MRRVAQSGRDEPGPDGAAEALPATRADLRQRPRYSAAVQTRNGKSRIDRSVIAEYVRSASASMPQKPKESTSAVDDELPASDPPADESDAAAAAATE